MMSLALLELSSIGTHTKDTKALSLVVHPHHCGFVDTSNAQVIDDVLFSPEEFLAQDLPTLSLVDQLAVHELVEVVLGLV